MLPPLAALTTVLAATCPDFGPLSALYAATGGDQWLNSYGWMRTYECCSWYGVSCNAASRVTALRMPNNNMVGMLPPDLVNVTGLTDLVFCHNKLHGPLPTWLPQLPALVNVSMRCNQFEGALPNEYTTFPKLAHLALSDNKLVSYLPADLGNVKTLSYVDLSHNALIGALPPALLSTPNLHVLDLSHNMLDGALPVIAKTSPLQCLRLDNNRLIAVPAMERPTQLVDCSLYNNSLHCLIPEWVMRVCGATCTRDHEQPTGRRDASTAGRSRRTRDSVHDSLSALLGFDDRLYDY
jgi:hypothetical protein